VQALSVPWVVNAIRLSVDLAGRASVAIRDRGHPTWLGANLRAPLEHFFDVQTTRPALTAQPSWKVTQDAA